MEIKSYLFIIALVVSISIRAEGEENNYKSMIVEGNQWNELISIETGGNPPYNVSTSIYKIGRDSIINNVVYKKIEGSSMLLREENKEVYRKDGLHPEYIAYDFSLKKGDILNTKMYLGVHVDELSDVGVYVIDIDSIEIEGYFRKHYFVGIFSGEIPPNPSDFYPNRDLADRQWVEGIGCIDGFEFSTIPVFAGSGQQLLCFYKNNELVYKPKEDLLCYYSSSVNRDYDDSWSIFLNTNNILRIKAQSEYSEYCLKLIDLRGSVLLSGRYHEEIEINLANMPKGQYVVEIMSGANKMIKKIIIY